MSDLGPATSGEQRKAANTRDTTSTQATALLDDLEDACRCLTHSNDDSHRLCRWLTRTESGRVDSPSLLVCTRCWETLFSKSRFASIFWSRERDFRDEYKYQVALPDLVRSAGRACSWCKFLAELWDEHIGNRTPTCQIARRHPETMAVVTLTRSSKEINEPVDSARLDVNIGRAGKAPNSRWFYACTPRLDAASEALKAGKVQPRVNSNDAFRQAKKWLRECAHHSGCPTPKETTLPDTVVEVKATAATGELASARLVRTGGTVQGRYATLSYCWGDGQPGVTTTRCLATRLAELDMTEISQAARDAIRCTAKLGVSYLWIDALCIVQDSEEDKRRNLVRMGDIYANAYVTLVALNTGASEESFLQDRPDFPPDWSLDLPLLCPSGALGTMSISSGRNLLHEKGRLETRGWCFQETVLAPRQLLYSPKTLQYSCRSAFVNLDNSSIASIHTQGLQQRLWRPSSSATGLSGDGAAAALRTTSTVLGEWCSIATEYSNRDTTYPEDRFHALSGVAQIFQQELGGCSYLAGLWEAQLAHQLTWKCSATPPHPRPQVQRAPSWSWMALDSRLSIDMSSGESFNCEVLECSTQLISGHLPFGPVFSGHLKLKGTLRWALLHSWGDSVMRGPQMLDTIFVCSTPVVSSFPDRKQQRRRRPRSTVINPRWYGPPGTFFPDSYQDAIAEPIWVYCMPVTWAYRKTVHYEPFIEGIVLQSFDKAKGTTAGCEFERIGCFVSGNVSDFLPATQTTISLY